MRHADTLKRMFAAIDANDFDALATVFAKDAVYERPGYDPLVGRDAIMHYYRNVRIIAHGRHTVDRFVEQDDAASCWGSFIGASRNDDPLAERFADCYLFDGDLLRRRITHFFRPAI